MELTWSTVAALFLAVFFAEMAMFGVSVALRAYVGHKTRKVQDATFNELMSAFEGQFVDPTDADLPDTP